MGLDYSFDLYFPHEEVWDVLQTLSTLATQSYDGPIEIHKSDGEHIKLPFSSNFKPIPVNWSPQTEILRFDTAFRIPIFADECQLFVKDTWQIDEHGFLHLGYVYLTIDFKPNLPVPFSQFEFTAATTEMSALFLESRSLRAFFSHMLVQHHGFCGLIDTEDEEPLLFWLNGRELSERPLIPDLDFADDEIEAAATYFHYYHRRFDQVILHWIS